ncbi:Scr1 family TA system antitoxin-like transcriptional regulator [Streptomyces sp. RKND-216]|uniref:Scr1 family TA system antitoxin-like transcriptional regulator n=1 Tax=Streptomyces sp. RKND-216 TaxID=2562581 RepID=UPI0024939BDB|nr:Scr1 family TA system antitoxin-like transcriptional regulator [Streptomyces sp. RKND-216]
MRAQYEHLLNSASRPNVTIQVMPSVRGMHAGLRGPMKLIETADSERLAYMEGNDQSTLVSKPDEVGVLCRRCAMIGRQALRPEESLALIEQLAGEL